MPTGLENLYATGPDLGPHIRYYVERALAKGAHRAKAEKWASQQVHRYRRRMPAGPPLPQADAKREAMMHWWKVYGPKK